MLILFWYEKLLLSYIFQTISALLDSFSDLEAVCMSWVENILEVSENKNKATSESGENPVEVMDNM